MTDQLYDLLDTVAKISIGALITGLISLVKARQAFTLQVRGQAIQRRRDMIEETIGQLGGYRSAFLMVSVMGNARIRTALESGNAPSASAELFGEFQQANCLKESVLGKLRSMRLGVSATAPCSAVEKLHDQWMNGWADVSESMLQGPDSEARQGIKQLESVVESWKKASGDVVLLLCDEFSRVTHCPPEKVLTP